VGQCPVAAGVITTPDTGAAATLSNPLGRGVGDGLGSETETCRPVVALSESLGEATAPISCVSSVSRMSSAGSSSRTAPVVLKIGRAGEASLSSEDAHAMRELGIFVKAKGIIKLLRRLYPEVAVQPEQVQKLLWEAYKAADKDYGEEEAKGWAEGFTFPPDVGERDARGVDEAGGLENYVRLRQAEIVARHGRMDVQRVVEVAGEQDPDFERALALVEGVPIFTSAEFTPNGRSPPLRKRYQRMHTVVNRLVYDLYTRGLVIILPTEKALAIPGVHFSMAHWTTKVGTPKGRFLGDVGALETGTPLNCEEVKLQFDEVMGKIEHPTLVMICEKIVEAAEKWGWDELVLFKMDLRSAFSLLFIRPEDVHLLALALTDGWTMMHIAGFFGYTGLPACFAVVSRILARAIGLLIIGFVLVYVDDLLFVTALAHLFRDMQVARQVCTRLLGRDAVEDAKTHSGRSLDMIGWHFDLDLRVVSISRRNFLKALLAFVNINVERATVGEMLKVASYASRYSTIIRSLKPFTSDLFSAIGGWTNKKHVLELSEDTRRAILVWRVNLVLLEMDRAVFARPIASVPPRPVAWLLEYDASLEGLGMIWSKVGGDGGQQVVWAMSLGLPFAFESQSAFQNTAEFLAVVVGLAVLAAKGVDSEGVSIRGDSRSSLKWAATQRFRQGPSRKAAMAFVSLGTRFGLTVEETEWIKGSVNVQCDRMSRGCDPTDCEVGLPASVVLRADDFPTVMQLLLQCDPTVVVGTDSDFEIAWGAVDRAVRALYP